MAINPERFLTQDEITKITSSAFELLENLVKYQNTPISLKTWLIDNSKKINEYLDWLGEIPDLPTFRSFSQSLTKQVQTIVKKANPSPRDLSLLKSKIRSLTKEQDRLTQNLDQDRVNAEVLRKTLNQMLLSEREYSEKLNDILTNESSYKKIFGSDRSVFIQLKKNLVASHGFQIELGKLLEWSAELEFFSEKEKNRILLNKMSEIYGRYTKHLKDSQAANKALIKLGMDKTDKQFKKYAKIEKNIVKRYEKQAKKRRNDDLHVPKHEELRKVVCLPNGRNMVLTNFTIDMMTSTNALGIDPRQIPLFDNAREEIKRREDEKKAKQGAAIQTFDKVFKEIMDTESAYRARLEDFNKFKAVLTQNKNEILGNHHQPFFDQIEHLIQLSNKFSGMMKEADEDVRKMLHDTPQHRLIEILNCVEVVYKNNMQKLADAIVNSVDLMASINRSLAGNAAYEKLRKEVNGLDLPSIAIEPVQRGPRYMLLARELLSQAEKAGIDKSGYTFLEVADKEMKRVNEARRASEESQAKLASQKNAVANMPSQAKVSKKDPMLSIVIQPASLLPVPMISVQPKRLADKPSPKQTEAGNKPKRPVLFLAPLKLDKIPSHLRGSISSRDSISSNLSNNSSRGSMVSPGRLVLPPLNLGTPNSPERNLTPPPVPKRPRLLSLPNILEEMRGNGTPRTPDSGRSQSAPPIPSKRKKVTPR